MTARSLSLLALLLLPASASAADCEAVYTSAELLSDVQAANSGLQVGVDEVVTEAGQRLADGIACMEEAVPGPMFATVYRLIGIARFHQEAYGEAEWWFRSARELEPTYQFAASEVEVGGALYNAWESAKAGLEAPAERVEGKDLSIANGAEVRLDGRKITEPSATPERYHLLQVVDGEGKVRGSWLVEGNRFPGPLLIEAGAAPEPVVEVEESDRKKDKKRRKDEELAGGYSSDDVVVLQRERPKGKIPLIVAGGVALAGAGGLYAASFSTRDSFDTATTEADLQNARTLTNTLVAASGGVAAVGLGLGYWGVALDGGAMVGLDFRF